MMSTAKPTLFILLLVAAGCGMRRDTAEAEALAARVHSQIQAGDYKAVYEAASPQIHKVATEAEFVMMMEQLHSDYGSLQKAVLNDFVIRMDINLGKMYIVTYNVEFERRKTSERIIFTASKKGAMELYELVFNPVD